MVTSILMVCCLTISFSLCIDGSCVELNNKSECYSDDVSKPFRLYGSKTTYTIARKSFQNDSFNYELPNCKPIMFYFIGRHAIRYPDGKEIVEMSEVLPKLQKSIVKAAEKGLTELCENDLIEIREWKFTMNQTDDNRISDTGVIETKAIAKEFKSRYPQLFNLNKVKIEVGITTKERTEQTADAFIEEIKLDQSNQCELKDKDSCEDDSNDKEVNDRNGHEKEITKTEKPFLYFHDTCDDLLSVQGVKLEKPKLVKDLRESDLMQKLFQRVNDRLGLKSDNLINAKIFKHVSRACYFEFAIYGQSPWCSVLGDEEFKVLEYLNDIDDFYEDAYGRDINSKQTCPLIGDLLDKVKSSIKNHKELRTYLHFTHGLVLKRLYSGLGLFNDLGFDSNSKSSEAICLSDNRKWKSSLVVPFSANFASVLFKCKNKDQNDDKDTKDKKSSEYKMLTLVQQNPVMINGCDSELCSVDKFISSYKTMASNCDLNEICKI